MSFFFRFFSSKTRRGAFFVPLLTLLLCCGALTGALAASQTADKAGELPALPEKAGVLLAVFGTSEPDALAAYKAIGKDFDALGVPVVWAYTSNIIRDKMARAGVKLATLNEALDELAGKGVQNVRVQSLHMAAGEEFSQMERGVYAYVLRHPGRFQSVCMGRPLLESARDVQQTVAAVLGEFPKERKSSEAVVLMGHGHSGGRADLPMFAARAEFNSRDPLVFLATVEGGLDFASLVPVLQARGVKHVWLAPFMVVAGDHARNDLTGSEAGSWASLLKAEGMTVSSNLKGLGELSGIRKVFVRHTLETHDDLLRVKGVN